jgi:hypothetical protein
LVELCIEKILPDLFGMNLQQTADILDLFHLEWQTILQDSLQAFV